MRPERRPGSLGNEASETGLRHELRALSAVLPYLWPKESRDLRPVSYTHLSSASA